MNILIVGDLHLSDKFQGQHKDYYKDVLFVMDSIEEKLKKLDSPMLFFLGDLFGVKEKRFTTRTFFLEVHQWLTRLNKLTEGNVFSVRGNHDISHSDLPEFEVFVRLGLVKVVDFLDWHDVRFHFVHYGNELNELDMSADFNVVLAHNDFGAPNHNQTWFEGNSLDASALPMKKSNLIITGHIHHPSVGAYFEHEGNEVPIIYPGCPSRVSERVSDVYTVLFTYTGSDVTYDLELFGLPPVDECFHPQTVTEAPTTLQSTPEELQTIVGNLVGYSLSEGNILKMIEARQDIRPAVKDLAVKFLQEVME